MSSELADGERCWKGGYFGYLVRCGSCTTFVDDVFTKLYVWSCKHVFIHVDPKLVWGHPLKQIVVVGSVYRIISAGNQYVVNVCEHGRKATQDHVKEPLHCLSRVL